MNKYDDYEFRAIAAEGDENWPVQWKGDCDESFQAYKKEIDKGNPVSALPFFRAQQDIYTKMTEEERESCQSIKKEKKSKNNNKKLQSQKKRFTTTLSQRRKKHSKYRRPRTRQ